MQIQRIGFNTIQLAVSCTDLRLSLVEVRLCPSFAVELLNLIALHIEEVTVVCLLVRGCKTTEDQDVLVRNLEKPTSLKADPISILLDLKVESLPRLPPFEVEFLNQVCSLTTIKTCDYIKRGAIKGDRRVEVSLCIETGNLSPAILRYIIYFTFVHGFIWQRRTDCEYLTFLSFNQDTSQSMSTSFKKHVPSLD